MSNWIPVTERLPENEVNVLISVERRRANKTFRFVCKAMYQNGTMLIGESDYCWEDAEFEYCEEKSDFLIPEGWWEQPDYSEEFHAVDDFVTHWMPLPEPYGEEK